MTTKPILRGTVSEAYTSLRTAHHTLTAAGHNIPLVVHAMNRLQKELVHVRTRRTLVRRHSIDLTITDIYRAISYMEGADIPVPETVRRARKLLSDEMSRVRRESR